VATYALECDGAQGHRFSISEFVERYRGVFGDAPELLDLLRHGHDYAQAIGPCGYGAS